eukprot:2949364-Prymnesium_polylepis.1
MADIVSVGPPLHILGAPCTKSKSNAEVVSTSGRWVRRREGAARVRRCLPRLGKRAAPAAHARD